MDLFILLITMPFLLHAIIASVLSSVVCGIIGPFVVVKRISHIAGGIAHSVFGGMGIAYYLGGSPLLGALISAFLAALLITWINIYHRDKEDTTISALWAVGMAIGIIFASKTPGYAADLMSYLFGNILLVNQRDIFVLGLLTASVIGIVAFFYQPLLLVCFDEEFAKLRGIPINRLKALLFVLIAMTVVILMQMVGMIMVIALLVLPAAIARQHVHTFGRMMIVSGILGITFTLSGIALSYYADLPVGAVVILVGGLIYFTDFILCRRRNA